MDVWAPTYLQGWLIFAGFRPVRVLYMWISLIDFGWAGSKHFLQFDPDPLSCKKNHRLCLVHSQSSALKQVLKGPLSFVTDKWVSDYKVVAANQRASSTWPPQIYERLRFGVSSVLEHVVWLPLFGLCWWIINMGLQQHDSKRLLSWISKHVQSRRIVDWLRQHFA